MTYVRRKAIAIFGAVLVPSAMLAPAASAAPADPPPPGVTVTVVSADEGCEIAEATVHPTSTKFTIRYWDFRALVGRHSSPGDERKKCQAVLRVTAGVPGFTYAISGVHFVGSAELMAGANGELTSQHGFVGTPPSQTWTHKLPGPHAAPFTFDDQVPLGQLAFNTCGQARDLTIETELGVSAGTSDLTMTSIMGLDTADDSVTYDLFWKPCT
ncbi:DUF4360 domain-containing protein [Actinomadura sp. KC216]|uniref:DUF4360 domain-containing protein n=1 Tax=Actinomadura sp. KC216 TaxID=2530370 RepID=UPI001052690C|nr:DUF4360 domain-containing protein [Actinomadura sp. KC216]TDB87083.1 DUF4360 domain-containing protein [Actinomadura sp. KC216]